jgi:eukaryotic-like serine/threonine-protein kinase
MPTTEDRRKTPRTTPRVQFLCIMQAKGFACNIDTCSQENLYVFADVKNCSESGVLVQVPFQLGTGTVVALALPDEDSGAWAMRSARVVWTRKNSANNYCTGIEYLGEDRPGKPQLVWESDPWKPSPSDLSFLMQSNFFQAIPRTELCYILNALHKTTAHAGERLISQGEPGDCLYMIQKGTCVVFIEKEGQTHRIAKLRQGDVVGEMAVLTGEPRTANVDAETDMVIWKLAGSQFDALAESHPDLRLFLTEIMSNRFDSSVFVGDRTIGKYVLSNKIGKGGWGIVYRGMHRLLKMPVAIKMMKHDMAMEQDFLTNFRQEAETIARMRHPNIVSVYDIEEVYKTIFIIMEYLEGVSLRDLLNKVGSLPVERCADILIQVCDGLACAHSYDVVHRDIKPGNIFLLENDQVKLLDFGLACAPGTADLDIAGTVYYAPPEQITGLPVDFKADLYSLGIMAFEMLTGERPFQPESNLAELMDMHCNMDIPDPRKFVPNLPRQFRDFIIRCCRRDPQERYHSMQQAKSELLAARGEHHQPVATAAERGVISLLLVHSSEQAQALKTLLEDFGNKADKLGVSLLLSEFKNV